MHSDLPSGVRQSAILHSVGRKLLKSHSEGQSHAWRQSGRSARNVYTMLARATVRLNRLGNDLSEIGGLPVLSGKDIMSLRQCGKAALKRACSVFRG